MSQNIATDQGASRVGGLGGGMEITKYRNEKEKKPDVKASRILFRSFYLFMKSYLSRVDYNPHQFLTRTRGAIHNGDFG